MMTLIKQLVVSVVLTCLLVTTNETFANAPANSNYQVRLDAGANFYVGRLYEAINDSIPEYDPVELGQYIGIAIHQPIDNKSALGTRIDMQNIGEHLLMSVRAIDYQYQIYSGLRANAFVGAARYQFRTPAYGYSAGLGLNYRPATWRNWGVQLEFQYFDTLARDKLTPEDPVGENLGPDSFFFFQALSLGVSYHF